MSDMIEPTLENVDGAPGVVLSDDDASTAVTAWINRDGSDDTPTWGQRTLHIQIDTDVDSDLTGYVVHLNDGPPIYQGNPEQHPPAVDVLRQVRDMLAGTVEPEMEVPAVLDLIRTSGVVL